MGTAWRVMLRGVVNAAHMQGIQMQPDTVTQFQADIFGGRWDAALLLLPQLTFDPAVAAQARGRLCCLLFWHAPPGCGLYAAMA